MKIIAPIALLFTVILSFVSPNHELLLGLCWLSTALLLYLRGRAKRKYPGALVYLCWFVGIIYFIILAIKAENL